MREIKKIVVIPVYNEENKVLTVLNNVAEMVDIIVLINDGSTDTSREKILDWKRSTQNGRIPQGKVFFIDGETNQGMASALKLGFNLILHLLSQRMIAKDDIIITIDGDGQHFGHEIDAICNYMIKNNYDVVITRRVLSQYPFIKRLGNRIMSFIASVMCGALFFDVECGYRFMRVEVLQQLMKYYTGYRYSCAQEIAIISSLLGCKICNNYQIQIAYYRSNTKIKDAILNVVYGFLALIRLLVFAFTSGIFMGILGLTWPGVGLVMMIVVIFNLVRFMSHNYRKIDAWGFLAWYVPVLIMIMTFTNSYRHLSQPFVLLALVPSILFLILITIYFILSEHQLKSRLTLNDRLPFPLVLSMLILGLGLLSVIFGPANCLRGIDLFRKYLSYPLGYDKVMLTVAELYHSYFSHWLTRPLFVCT